jgi:serine/threonine protein kinase
MQLPFDGANHDEIIRCTIQAEMKVSPTTWNKLTDEAKSLVKALLHRNPKERISARAALRHPFIAKYFPNHRRGSMVSVLKCVFVVHFTSLMPSQVGDNSSVGSQSLPPPIPTKSRNPSDHSVDSVNTSNVGLTIM